VFGPSSFRRAPDSITNQTGGAPSVAALVALPLALLGSRRRWGAFVLGGSVSVLAINLTPALFPRFAEVVSIPQSLRLVHFLPWSFALAGGAMVLSRLKQWGLILSAAAGLGLSLLYRAEFRISSPIQHGAAWAVWFGLVAGTAALIAGRFVKGREGGGSPAWVVAIAVAFIFPLMIRGLSNIEHRNSRTFAPGLIQAVREDVPNRAVVLATPRISYRIQAYAPVYIVAAPARHSRGRATTTNRVTERLADVKRFFSNNASNADRRRILKKYGVSWIIVDKAESGGRYVKELLRRHRPNYEDVRHALYPWTGRGG
jgi:hypothetical protein